MKKYKKYWFYLLLALSISITVLIINDINDKLIPKIVQDINSGVIGAILTTIITLILLSNQSESQDKINKNSVVYEEKLKIFNSFLDILGKSLEDGKLSNIERLKILYSFSTLRIHITNESSLELERALSSIDNYFLYVDENSVQNFDKYIILYTQIANVFRKELYGYSKNDYLDIFNFDNFKEIAFKKRAYPLQVNDINEFSKELSKYNEIMFEDKLETIVFELNNNLIENFKLLFEFMQTNINKLELDIQMEFMLTKYIVNNSLYCGIPWIKLLYKKNYFAHFGISQRKRFHLTSKLESKLIFSFEADEVAEINSYANTIEKFLRQTIEKIDKN